MKARKLVLGIVLQTTLAALAASFAFAAPQTLTGVVSDDMCGKKHTMMPGKPDSECIRACVKAGSKYAWLVGDKIYALNSNAKQIDQFAGKKVKVAGGDHDHAHFDHGSYEIVGSLEAWSIGGGARFNCSAPPPLN